MRKVLVTGSSGFLGRHVVTEMRRHDDIQVTEVSHDALLRETFNDIDTVIHCAFPRSNDARVLAEALDFTERSISHYEKMGVASVINISSQGIYQRLDAYHLSDENSPIQPIDMYSMVKYATEKMFSLSSLPSVTNIRLASLIMPQRFLSFFVRKVKNGEIFTVTAPNQYAALLDVVDAASGLLAVVNLPHQSRAAVYNLGTNTHYSLLEYAESVKAIGQSLGYSADFEVADNGTNVCAGMDCTRLMNATGWKPMVSKDEMIKKLFKEI